jgi:hypothetical protein
MANIDTITVTICAQLCRHCEEFMRKKAPPPRNWDGKTKLPWPIDIYYKGERIGADIAAYDLDAGWYKWTTALDKNTVNTGPNGFLVQRRH